MSANFEESKHPRDGDGKFAIKDGSEPSQDVATKAYSDREIPDGWFVHGRASQNHLREDYAVQMTRRWEVAEQYSGKNKNKPGSMWMVKPKSDAKILDMGDNSQVEELATQLKADFEDGNLAQYPDIEEIVANNAEDESSWEQLVSELNPPDIVDSAGFFDVPGFTGWLLHEKGYGFVLTNDGAVCLDTEQCHVRMVDAEQSDSDIDDAVKQLTTRKPM
jgi:hypothetical protein